MLATIEPTWQLALTVDQRLVDAPLAAAFLGRLKELLEAPKRLL
jgi:pyruvate/2-oxoglutarate dehydrogenase complex dihydrolipoamide acyltransferase (E2) component